MDKQKKEKKPKREPISVIELSKDPLRFDGRHEFCLMLNRFVDYYKVSWKSLPEYLAVEREHYEKMRKAALSRKKVAVKAGVSFSYEGIPLVCFSPVKVEV